MSKVAEIAKRIVARMTAEERELALQELMIGAYWHNGRQIGGLDELGAQIEKTIKSELTAEDLGIEPVAEV